MAADTPIYVHPFDGRSAAGRPMDCRQVFINPDDDTLDASAILFCVERRVTIENSPADQAAGTTGISRTRRAAERIVFANCRSALRCRQLVEINLAKKVSSRDFRTRPTRPDLPR